MLDNLIRLDDPKDPGYDKVMFYQVQYTTHGDAFSAFANDIKRTKTFKTATKFDGS